MAKTISLGKYAALSRASTAAHVFSIMAIDHQDALRQVMRPHDPQSLSYQTLVDFKLAVVEALEPAVSGLLLDAVIGAPPAILRGLTRRVGLLLELEKADYSLNPLPLTVEIDPAWRVEKIKRLGAEGVKLFFYYNPAPSAHRDAQEAILGQVVADCSAYDIPFYAEPIMIDVAPEDFSAALITSAERVAALGVDVLKLEFPFSIQKSAQQSADQELWLAACQALTNAIDIPWVLLSAGVDFPTFAAQVEIACKGGASGFIAGRALWGDACNLPSLDDQQAWLASEGRARIQQLAMIAEQYAAPWSERLTAPTFDENWFKTY